MLLGRFAADRVHLVSFQRRQTRVEQLGLDRSELDALDRRVVEAVEGSVQ